MELLLLISLSDTSHKFLEQLYHVLSGSMPNYHWYFATRDTLFHWLNTIIIRGTNIITERTLSCLLPFIWVHRVMSILTIGFCLGNKKNLYAIFLFKYDTHQSYIRVILNMHTFFIHKHDGVFVELVLLNQGCGLRCQ